MEIPVNPSVHDVYDVDHSAIEIRKNHHFADQKFHTKSHGASRDGRDGSAGGEPCTWRGRGGLMATRQGTQGPNRQEWPGERRGKSLRWLIVYVIVCYSVYRLIIDFI